MSSSCTEQASQMLNNYSGGKGVSKDCAPSHRFHCKPAEIPDSITCATKRSQGSYKRGRGLRTGVPRYTRKQLVKGIKAYNNYKDRLKYMQETVKFVTWKDDVEAKGEKQWALNDLYSLIGHLTLEPSGRFSVRKNKLNRGL